jgi:tellurite resistance protein
MTQHDQAELWVRGLLMVAWADGDFDPAEQELVATLVQHPVASGPIQPVTAAELQAAFSGDGLRAEDFLRTAVMVAIADGVYTTAEDDLLTGFATALGCGATVLAALRSTLVDAAVAPITESITEPTTERSGSPMTDRRSETIDPLQPVRQWLDRMQVQDPQVARFLCRLIPNQCPFERDVVLFGKKIVHIPPMCKINPLYEQLVGLRFRALSYLADDLGEDISAYL